MSNQGAIAGASGGAPSGSAGGDLGGTYPNPSVATVGGSTAANINTATALVNTAQSGNKVFASPANGSSAAPGYRVLVTADMPAVVNASGTVATMIALTGTTGQSFFCTTYNTWFDWIVDRWWPRRPDPRYGFMMHDEFGGLSGGSQMGWNVSGGGGVANTGTYHGVYYVEQTTAATRAYIASYTAGCAFGLTDYYIEALVQIPTLATVGEDFCATFGFNDNLAYDANGACTDGAYITMNRAVNGKKWITNTTNNGTNTATNTSVTDIVAGTWYRLGISVSQTNGNVVFYQNGTVMATHTTNRPSGAARSTGILFKLDKTAGSAASDMYIDYFSGYGMFTTARA